MEKTTKAKSITGERKKTRKSLLEHSSRVSLEAEAPAVFALDFPRYCREYGAFIIPEITVQEGARPGGRGGSMEKVRDGEGKQRKSRVLSISPGHASLPSADSSPSAAPATSIATPAASVTVPASVAVPAPGSTAAAGAVSSFASSPAPAAASIAQDADDLEAFFPPAGVLIQSFEDDKKRDTLRTLTFKGVPLEDAHIKALAKCLPQHPALKTLKFKKTHLEEKLIILMSETFVEADNVSEIHIYDNPVAEQNFYLILRDCKSLQVLVLRGCKINDDGVELLAKQLCLRDDNTVCSLRYLNLSLNLIEDEGAKALAKALRLNRRLAALTLSGNFVGDAGAIALGAALSKFELTDEEAHKRRSVVLLRIKAYQRLAQGQAPQADDAKKKINSQEVSHPKMAEKPRASTRGSNFSGSKPRAGTKISMSSPPDLWKLVDEEPEIRDQVLLREVWPESGKLWCSGNLHLAHLNLSHNRINILGAQKFLQTLCYQKTFQKVLAQNAPNGLVNLVLIGNPIPDNWPEWPLMSELLAQLPARRASTDAPRASLRASNAQSDAQSSTQNDSQRDAKSKPNAKSIP